MNENHFDKEFNPLFNPIQSNDAIIYAKKLENELKKLKIENKELKEEINCLKIKNKHKDKLLDSKSKQIISSTSETLRLKQDIEKLKKRINKFNVSNKRKKKSRTKILKRRKNEIELIDINNKNSLSLSSLSSVQSSFDSDFSENTEANTDEIMPYELPQITTSISTSSNLSAQACNLSLPMIQDSNPPPYIPKATIVRVLTPIAENIATDIDDNDDENTTISPTLALRISDNNVNIQMDEWGDCIASIDSSDNHHASQSDDESSVSFRSDTAISMEKNKEQCMVNNILSDDEYSMNKQSEDVISYMSDNTMMLMDICLDLNINNKHLLNILGDDNELDMELSMKSQQIYNDNIIKPPFNLMNNEAVCNLYQ